MDSGHLNELQSKFHSLLSSKSEDDLLKEEEFILMANYLSEIERLQELEGVKFVRKELAKQIKVSASYLTQVFRGDKPLNFRTIAKIQRALKIKFHVRGTLETQLPVYLPYEFAPVNIVANTQVGIPSCELGILSSNSYQISLQTKSQLELGASLTDAGAKIVSMYPADGVGTITTNISVHTK
jgi:transcriptional regulator with XRE-family HTH domain